MSSCRSPRRGSASRPLAAASSCRRRHRPSRGSSAAADRGRTGGRAVVASREGVGPQGRRRQELDHDQDRARIPDARAALDRRRAQCCGCGKETRHDGRHRLDVSERQRMRQGDRWRGGEAPDLFGQRAQHLWHEAGREELLLHIVSVCVIRTVRPLLYSACAAVAWLSGVAKSGGLSKTQVN